MIAINNHVLKLTGAIIACAVISACSNSDVSNPPVPPLNTGDPSSGTADFSKYVSIGDSLTAGYADGALYLLGQKNSFPNILAQQFANADGVAVSFDQPLVGGNDGGLLVNGTAGILENRFVLNSDTKKPERLTTTPTEDVTTSGLSGSFNNMGVPGAKSFHLAASGYGNPAGLAAGAANPYFVRFAVTQATSSVIGDAIAQAPSFFTLWIGNNDVLSFATSGGVGIDQTGTGTNPALYGPDDITDPAAFAGSIYPGIVGAITTANPAAQGVLINIPDVSTIPFFTTVPYNPVPLDQASADALNAAYAAYNDGVAAILGASDPDQVAKRKITFAAGQNAVVILDETLTDLTVINPPATSALLNMRQATAADLIILPTSAIIGELVNPADDPNDPASPRWGISAPLQDKDVLDAAEVQAVNTARLAMNVAIKAAADANPNFVYLDAAAIMTQLSTSGVDFGSGSINADFATGGAFSLDGVHPTARGYAVIANSVIDAINGGFGANVHKVDPALYPTIFLK